MTPVKYNAAIVLALLLLGACKAKDADDPHNPANHYNQPPLGKDTVRGILTSLDLGSQFSGIAYARAKDDDGSVLYDIQLWYHYLPERGFSSITTNKLIGPDTRLTAFPNGNAILIENPLPFMLTVSMYPGRPKLTLDVKQLYLRATSETKVYFDASDSAQRTLYLRPDSTSRAMAKQDIETTLMERLGRYTSNYPDRSPVSSIFQRNK